MHVLLCSFLYILVYIIYIIYIYSCVIVFGVWCHLAEACTVPSVSAEHVLPHVEERQALLRQLLGITGDVSPASMVW